jgi:hypothetical protein
VRARGGFRNASQEKLTKLNKKVEVLLLADAKAPEIMPV